MGRRAARATHLTLWIVGFLLYIVFVIPRWWVLTGDVPATAATFGRIVTGFPIAAAAVPVGLTLQRSLKQESRIPALALRLRAWSAVLHVIAGVLIVATAVAEVWLTSQAAAPWLFGVYGGAGALAVLAALAFVLSFPAELPPPPPKPARIKPAKQSDKAPKQRRTRKRGRKQSGQEPEKDSDQEPETAETESGESEPDDPAAAPTALAEESAPDSAASVEGSPDTAVEPEGSPDTAVVPEGESTTASETDGSLEAETSSASSPSENARPVGKKRHRLRR